MIPVADNVTIAVPVTISMTLTNRYASAANTNPHLFRSSRYCAANSSHGGDHYGIPNHCVLLSLLSSSRPIPRRLDRSLYCESDQVEKRLRDSKLVTAAQS